MHPSLKSSIGQVKAQNPPPRYTGNRGYVCYMSSNMAMQGTFSDTSLTENLMV
jgi:hypothetical protein